MTRLAPGDPAPPFVLPTADGTSVSSAELRHRRAVVYFYPAAGTPGCTAQACDFRDNLGSLSAAGYAVVGISPDAPEDLARFRDEQSLPFPLLADRDHAVHEAYGTWGEKTVDDRRVIGTIRSTFVLDEDGRVAHALYDVPARGHVAELRRLLGAEEPAQR
ncbi:peroxiredoxin [Geodermatophilus sp. YIM 151500]|uniref:peroxiredoxin n=1 Tax=Geodermatophilus sp. YIM 151500 TaxID=2984531 RepID=UPI0021E49EF2|nr:peroxiredoxin [Geodermatophilus sp. YIM 151500]MCV2487752.1 peroxiredoxin [Geodermatophilus sp. YIM 151500]